MRLPNGYGSVHKLSGNRRKPWTAVVTLGYAKVETEDGPKSKRETLTLGYYEKRADAFDALVTYNKKPIGYRLKMTLEDLYDEYKKIYDTLNRSTSDGYKAAWKHLEPIKDMEVRDIRKTDIQDVIDALVEKGMSHSSYSKVKVLAGILLDKAMEDDVVDKNYARFVDIPSGQKKTKEIFTDAHIKTLFKHSKNEWVQTILILIYTGMRIGELLTLTKFDVDLDQMVIVGGIKTDAGKNRTIPIHSKVQPFIRAWYDKKSDYLISRDGKKVSVDYYRKKIFYPTIEELGIVGVTPHATRHTFATLLNRAKVDTLSIQRIIGHSDYNTTANIYTQTDIKTLKKAIESI